MELISNFLSPPILFFFIGIIANFLKSELEIPQQIAKFLSLYLLISIGIHGGYELSKSPLNFYVLKVLFLAIFMGIFVPTYLFFLIKNFVDIHNAVAISATYGSISAVTFITASSFLQELGQTFNGSLIAAMALMESPAIIIAILIYQFHLKENKNYFQIQAIREAFLNPSVYLLITTLIIGIIVGEKGYKSIEPFFGNLFRGMLCLFLLDMGILTARILSKLKKLGIILIIFSILIPLLNASIGIILSKLFSLNKNDAFMFVILCASASYIAVPAAMRLSVPKANPSIYLTMSLTLTFPFNIIFGIPLYYSIINFLWK